MKRAGAARTSPSLAIMAHDPAALGHIREQVGRALREFLDQQRAVLLRAGGELLPTVEALEDLLAAGKRLRPAFCYWGWRGAGGEDCPPIMVAAAALELLHASALVHDDVIDGSDTRRGRPSLHPGSPPVTPGSGGMGRRNRSGWA